MFWQRRSHIGFKTEWRLSRLSAADDISQGGLVSGLVGKQYTPVTSVLLFSRTAIGEIAELGNIAKEFKNLVGNEAAK